MVVARIVNDLMLLRGNIGTSNAPFILSTCAENSFSYEGLCKALEQFADFEKKANSRVVQSEVLKGLSQEDIKRAGQGLILQDGCKGFFQKIMKNENLAAAVHILSYCWCGDLIRSAFSSGNP